MITLREEPHSAGPPLSDLLPDETLSSWVNRHRGRVRATSDADEGESGEVDGRELDFDSLQIDLPSAPPELITKLRHSAEAPDLWDRLASSQPRYCPACHLGDWSTGRPKYFRRSWAVAWQTCCPKHGPLIKLPYCGEEESVHRTLAREPWRNGTVQLSRNTLLCWPISIFRDNRALHLEAALRAVVPASKPAWFPRTLTRASLRPVYRLLITALVAQLSDALPFDRSFPIHQEVTDDEAFAIFAKLPIERQFALNVFAEAILAVWSETPLPVHQASELRTRLLVRMLGWRFAAPPRHHEGDVLFRSPSGVFRPPPVRLEARCAERLGHSLPKEVGRVTSHDIWLTKRELECLGWDGIIFGRARALKVVADLTNAGRLGSFDRKRGRLKRIAHPVPLSMVETERLQSEGVRLPPWVDWEVADRCRLYGSVQTRRRPPVFPMESMTGAD